MGFFTDAYDLFCISTVSKLLGRLYYYKPWTGTPGKLPHSINNLVIGVALVGTLTGQLVFGYLGDKLGRKKVYGVTLILMALCCICSGLSFGYSPKAVMGTLCFFRFWLGFGIGGLVSMIIFQGLPRLLWSLKDYSSQPSPRPHVSQPSGPTRVENCNARCSSCAPHILLEDENARNRTLHGPDRGQCKTSCFRHGRVLDIDIPADQEKNNSIQLNE
ncbi:Inorganic phosphate transporter 1-11 [Sesamum angolense]|uniref:Inorganic phosphate transporter 1-11 n=1 Tax=Sesamum angolense TaxID=2727404 RepID=A0AAE1X2B6_9LAMI|nr:Inorganic phosphate transporter 1-11 [Sesamum angolense]